MRYARKRPTNKRKRYNRRYRLYRPIKRYSKSGQNKIYYFTRYSTQAAFASLQVNNIVPTPFTYVFLLFQVDAFDFTTLFDVYKIKAVKVTFLPQMTENVSASSFNNPIASARIYSVIDYNDSAVLSSVDEARSYKSMRSTSILKPHSRYLKPKILDDGGNYNPVSPWINTTSPLLKHFGLKVIVDPMGSTSVTDIYYSVLVKFYLAFKNVR